MKKSLLLLLLIAAFISCDRYEKSIINEDFANSEITLSSEQKEIRNALETTTEIILDMISEDCAYLAKLNNCIIKGSLGCLDSRVLFKDLFNCSSFSESNSSQLSYSIHNFRSDFVERFENRNKEQSTKSMTSPLSDFFIQYLEDNNFSLYCPFPLEDYETDNRIPTITFHPIDNDSVNIGYLFDKESGSFIRTKVNQEYADLHPVWIVMPHEKLYNTSSGLEKKVNDLPAPNDGFEVIIREIFCTEYFEGLFQGDLEIVILRSESTPDFNMTNYRFEGGFNQFATIILQRSYVRNARNNYWKGWKTIDLLWDYSWKESLTEQVFTVYEHDNTYSSELEVSAAIKAEYPIVVNGETIIEAGTDCTATYRKTYSSEETPIVIMPIGRTYMYNIGKYGHKNSNGIHDWLFQGESLVNGYYIFQASSIFKMTIQIID